MNKNKDTSGSMAFAFAFAFDLACACTGCTNNRAAARALPFCKGRDASYRTVHDVLLLLFSFACRSAVLAATRAFVLVPVLVIR